MLPEFPRFTQWNRLAARGLSVTPHNLGEAQGKRPLNVDGRHDLVLPRISTVDARSSTSPVVVKSRRASGSTTSPHCSTTAAVQLDVVDVHVRVQLVGVVELEHVDFTEDALALAQIAQVVEQIERAIAEAG